MRGEIVGTDGIRQEGGKGEGGAGDKSFIACLPDLLQSSHWPWSRENCPHICARSPSISTTWGPFVSVGLWNAQRQQSGSRTAATRGRSPPSRRRSTGRVSDRPPGLPVLYPRSKIPGVFRVGMHLQIRVAQWTAKAHTLLLLPTPLCDRFLERAGFEFLHGFFRTFIGQPAEVATASHGKDGQGSPTFSLIGSKRILSGHPPFLSKCPTPLPPANITESSPSPPSTTQSPPSKRSRCLLKLSTPKPNTLPPASLTLRPNTRAWR